MYPATAPSPLYPHLNAFGNQGNPQPATPLQDSHGRTYFIPSFPNVPSPSAPIGQPPNLAGRTIKVISDEIKSMQERIQRLEFANESSAADIQGYKACLKKHREEDSSFMLIACAIVFLALGVAAAALLDPSCFVLIPVGTGYGLWGIFAHLAVEKKVRQVQEQIDRVQTDLVLRVSVIRQVRSDIAARERELANLSTHHS